ncbi:MAG: hypothetical protein IPM56_08995 [Ignavibacteriales bacterium]|nr:MAG: hypothetical protein IPM56_08995 [Ignavibacteriales bacterium]
MLQQEKSSTVLLTSGTEKILWKLTALWGFSEAALGGLLHGLKLPFRGMFVASAAIIFITLIAHYSDKKGTILKSTLIVIIIKGVVSPHTPVTAYLAVFLQGLFGELFFYSRSMFRTSSILLGIFVMLSAVVQKILILTILFGETLWKSIDEFTIFVLNQFLISDSNDINFSVSIILISVYAVIHLSAGIIIGIIAGRMPSKLNSAESANRILIDIMNNDTEAYERSKKSGRRKKWWRKKSGMALLIFSILFVVTSYIFPEFGEDRVWEIVIMLVRSIVIISLWYFVVSPMLLKLINKFLKKKESEYSKEILKMIESFPYFRKAVKASWKFSSSEKGLKRLTTFVSELLALILHNDIALRE